MITNNNNNKNKLTMKKIMLIASAMLVSLTGALHAQNEYNILKHLEAAQANAKTKEEKALKEAEKVKEFSERSSMREEDVISKATEKLALKEAEKAKKEAEKALKKDKKEAEKAKKLRFKEAEKILDDADRDEKIRAKKTEKALKEAEKLALKEKKNKKAKTVKKVEHDSDDSTVIMTDSENEDSCVLFQNIPLINEINSIRDVKKNKNWKKLSTGVKLARQILDI